MQTTNAINIPDFRKALEAALAAPVGPVNPSCCGRVYLEFYGLNRAAKNALAKAASALGLRYLAKWRGGPAIYVGYDNASGRELAKGEAMAVSLRASGLSVSSEGYED